MIWLPPSSVPDGVRPHWFDITHHWPFSSARAGYSPSHQLSASSSYALTGELAEADRLNAALWENRREELYIRADAWAPAHDPQDQP